MVITLHKITDEFSICQVADITQVDFSQEFVFLSKTTDEISLVCETAHTPPNIIACENGWKALKIAGVLDFGLVGIVAKISTILAQAGISIFVVSTYNTDYILLKSETFYKGIEELERNEYVVK